MDDRGLLPDLTGIPGLPSTGGTPSPTSGSFPGGFPGMGGFPGGPGTFPGFPGSQPPFPGGSPGGFPPPPGGGFPPFPGGGQGQLPGGQVGAPTSPPPTFTPTKPSQQLYAVDAGSLRNCLFRYVYIWQTDGQQYWMYLTFVGRRSIAGYRWVGFGSFGYWFYFGLDTRRISQFICY